MNTAKSEVVEFQFKLILKTAKTAQSAVNEASASFDKALAQFNKIVA